MSILSINAPEQVRKDGNFYKYLKLQQETEHSHAILNKLEVRYECVRNKAYKYFLILKAFKNMQKTDSSLFQKSIPNLKVIKSCFSHFIFIITLYSVCTCWFNIGTTKCNYDISVIKSGPFLTAPKMLGVLSKWVGGVVPAHSTVYMCNTSLLDR